MFIGEYQHSLDEKGRLAIPAKFRTALAKGAIINKGVENCLSLHSKEEWKNWAEKLAKLPDSQANSRAYQRFMLGSAMDVELDKQGRVIIPDYLRQYANLTKKVVVVGLYDRMEIWDEDKWTHYKQNIEKEGSDISEQIAELGI
jgi:MraZ protein